jgi:hypothetical protein
MTDRRLRRVLCALLITAAAAAVSAAVPIGGTEALFNAPSPLVYPKDAVIGTLADPDPLSYEAGLIAIAREVLYTDYGDYAKEGDSAAGMEVLYRHLSPASGMMFLALNAESLLPLLPADHITAGKAAEQNGTVRLPLRLYLARESLTGELFFQESADGWKIISGSFNFPTAAD